MSGVGMGDGGGELKNKINIKFSGAIKSFYDFVTSLSSKIIFCFVNVVSLYTLMCYEHETEQRK